MKGGRPVPGLGDDAFFDGFLDVLFVRVGDLDFQLQIVLPLTNRRGARRAKNQTGPAGAGQNLRSPSFLVRSFPNPLLGMPEPSR